MSGPKVTHGLSEFRQGVLIDGARGMTQALVLGASEASVLTPVATSVLLNSQFRHVEQKGDQVVGTVGYTAAYAKYVHDPKVKQTFTRSSAEKEFLRKGFERSQKNIEGVLTGAIKTK